MHPFRIFVSYTEQDRKLAEALVGTLRKIGARPTWDEDFRPGRLFLEEIKEKIATAHLFVPLLTSASQQRPWVHQETGYALAMNVPVLPIALGSLPSEMLAGLQALVVGDLSDMKRRLREVEFESLVLPPQPRPPVLYSIADLPESRTEAIVSQGTRLAPSAASGRIRQRALFSSFSIPDEEATATVWDDLDREQTRSVYFRQLLCDERRLLERQAKDCGCTLIITPLVDPGPVGPLVHRIRIETLIGFLESVQDSQVDVVFAERFDLGNETIVGDVFLARALPPHPNKDYRQTLLTSHAPTILQACRAFDDAFRRECRRQGIEPGHSRALAIDRLRVRLRELSV